MAGILSAPSARLSAGLVTQAEALGVEIAPGFAGVEALYDENGAVVGIATGDKGVGRDGKPKSNFSRGVAIFGKYVLIAEGARGSLAKELIANFDLDRDAAPQTYGIGLKELWSVPAQNHRPGAIAHFLGWPLDDETGGGSFLYQLDDGLISIGTVVHLNYRNPTLSPFDEFQRFKTHPHVAAIFNGGKRLSYGARAITEGGWQSVPKLSFPAARSSAARQASSICRATRARITRSSPACSRPIMSLRRSRKAAPMTNSHPMRPLGAHPTSAAIFFPARNAKPLWSKFGTRIGIALAGLDLWINQLFGVSLFGTLKHDVPDYATLKPLADVTPLAYQKPDGTLTFDRLSSVFVSNTEHEADQPVHLHLRDPSIPIAQNLPRYGEPARLYCPAGVYEVIYADEAAKAEPRFVINAANCVHCKTCDIKDPAQNIDWTPPEGGDGPNYRDM